MRQPALSPDLVARAAAAAFAEPADEAPLAAYTRRLTEESSEALTALAAGMTEHLSYEISERTAHARAMLAAIVAELRSRDAQTPSHASADGGYAQRFADTIESMPPIAEADDATVVSMLAEAHVEREAAVAEIDDIIARLRGEIERRLRERRAAAPTDTQAIAIPHPSIEIVLEPQFSAYAFSVPKLRAAAALLPDDEAAKIVRHVPEQTTVVPAHDEPGATVSIAALQRKYAGSEVGYLLAEAVTRKRLDDKLVIKPRATKLPARRAS